jgi:hypothetical protein
LWQSLRVQPESLPLREVTFDVGQITAKSLKLLILPPLAGHFFGFGDQACRVAMANEEAAKMLFFRWFGGRNYRGGSHEDEYPPRDLLQPHGTTGGAG